MIAFWVHYFIKAWHAELKSDGASAKSGTGVYEQNNLRMREHYRKTSRVKVSSTLRFAPLLLSYMTRPMSCEKWSEIEGGIWNV